MRYEVGKSAVYHISSYDMSQARNTLGTVDFLLMQYNATYVWLPFLVKERHFQVSIVCIYIRAQNPSRNVIWDSIRKLLNDTAAILGLNSYIT